MLPPQSARWREAAAGTAPPAHPPRAPSGVKPSTGGRAWTGPWQPDTRSSVADVGQRGPVSGLPAFSELPRLHEVLLPGSIPGFPKFSAPTSKPLSRPIG